MEQDQEDFERDQRASNNIAENLEFFRHDPVPTSSTPLPESANPNLELADLSFLDEFKDIDFSFGPSELPAPTQTTSSIPVLQAGNPTEGESFSLLNLNADASYTDHHAPESLAPLATVHSVPVAQSTDFAGHDMYPFNHMDAPYANIDPQQLLAPTTATGLVQAAQSADLMEDGTSRITELDPDPVMAPSGPAPTSFEQLPPPFSTDRIFPAEVAQSANPMTNFNGSGPPNSSNLVSHPPPLAPLSNEMITTMSTPGKQLQSELKNSLCGRAYVPLRPKAATASPNTELLLIGESQESSPLRFPSQGTLASRPASSVSKGKRKRLRSPQAPPSAYQDCLNEFSVAAKEEQNEQPATKRTRSAKACLRCQLQNKAVNCPSTLRILSWADMSIVFGRLPLREMCELV